MNDTATAVHVESEDEADDMAAAWFDEQSQNADSAFGE